MVSGNPNKHFMYSLNVDTGGTNPGWPVDVNATASYNGMPFISTLQEQRGSLALVNGIVYVAYSGFVGDCGKFHGCVVGADINNPVNVGAWATTAMGGGIWGHGGALPAMVPTCLWLPVTRLTRGVTGWGRRSYYPVTSRASL
jgi:hypothetical protein